MTITSRLRIGLTGGIASGKTTAALRFAELGVPVIDADESARCVVAPGTPGLASIVERFGRAALRPDGQLDRSALRDIVFADPVRRRELEAILHPLIREDMEHRAAAALGPYVVLAIPLLLESGAGHARVDRVLVIDVDEHTQLERLMARHDSTPEQARAIIAAQASRQARLAAADDVILNLGNVADLRQSVDQLHRQYSILASAHPRAGQLS